MLRRKWRRDPPSPSGWPGRYINVRSCGGLSMVLMQLKDPLELFVKIREFLPGSGFLSHRDMTQAVESDVKTQFLPSFPPPRKWPVLTSMALI